MKNVLGNNWKKTLANLFNIDKNNKNNTGRKGKQLQSSDKTEVSTAKENTKLTLINIFANSRI